jgi:hypothetical protein
VNCLLPGKLIIRSSAKIRDMEKSLYGRSFPDAG